MNTNSDISRRVRQCAGVVGSWTRFRRAATLGILIAATNTATTTDAADNHAHAAGHHEHSARTAAEGDRKTGRDVVSLDVYASGSTLHVLYAIQEHALDRVVLLATRSTDGGVTWSEPARVDAGGPAPLARGRGTDFQIAAAGDRVVAIWITAGSGFGGRGPLACARSENGGEHWIPGATPADDGTDGDHGFIDVAATPAGDFHAVWLDARAGAGKGLYSARSEDGGATWLKNRTIDAQTCECCPNTLQTAPDGRVWVLYRDIDPRDMAAAFSEDEGMTWRSLAAPGSFGWQFQGCPHAGGALAVESSRSGSTRLHAIVWTGKEEHIGLHYLNTRDAAREWGTPARLGGVSARHPDLAISSHGELAASWTEHTNGGTRLFVSGSRDGGSNWSTPESICDPANAPDHPRLVAHAGAFHLFWTQATPAGVDWRHRIVPVVR